MREVPRLRLCACVCLCVCCTCELSLLANNVYICDRVRMCAYVSSQYRRPRSEQRTSRTVIAIYKTHIQRPPPTTYPYILHTIRRVLQTTHTHTSHTCGLHSVRVVRRGVWCYISPNFVCVSRCVAPSGPGMNVRCVKFCAVQNHTVRLSEVISSVYATDWRDDCRIECNTITEYLFNECSAAQIRRCNSTRNQKHAIANGLTETDSNLSQRISNGTCSRAAKYCQHKWVPTTYRPSSTRLNGGRAGTACTMWVSMRVDEIWMNQVIQTVYCATS